MPAAPTTVPSRWLSSLFSLSYWSLYFVPLPPEGEFLEDNLRAALAFAAPLCAGWAGHWTRCKDWASNWTGIQNQPTAPHPLSIQDTHGYSWGSFPNAQKWARLLRLMSERTRWPTVHKGSGGRGLAGGPRLTCRTQMGQQNGTFPHTAAHQGARGLLGGRSVCPSRPRTRTYIELVENAGNCRMHHYKYVLHAPERPRG